MEPANAERWRAAAAHMLAHRGETKQLVLKYVAAHPGATVSEITQGIGKRIDNTVGAYIKGGSLQRRVERGLYHYYPADYALPGAEQRTHAPTPAGRRRAVGESERILVDYLTAHPGLTGTQITQATGIPTANIHRTLAAGAIAKDDDKRYYVPGQSRRTQTVYTSDPTVPAPHKPTREEFAAMLKELKERREHTAPAPEPHGIADEATEDTEDASEASAPPPLVETPLAKRRWSDRATEVERMAMRYVWETGADAGSLRKFIEWVKHNG
jgi:hypothetical protein